jgi:N-methylhydantoinase A
VRRGVDPTGFALLAFGGAAGLHVTAVARQLSMRRVIVPRVASVLSAWGMLASDIRYEVTRTHIGDAALLQAAGLRDLYAGMEAEGRARLKKSFDGPIRASRSADMRYGEQIFEINVPLDDVDWTSERLAEAVAERFHRRHEELYTYAQPGHEVVLVNARTAVIGELPALPREPLLEVRGASEPMRRQHVFLGGGWRDVPVFAFEALSTGQEIAGPALVEGVTTTVLLGDGDRARATEHGWLDVALE